MHKIKKKQTARKMQKVNGHDLNKQTKLLVDEYIVTIVQLSCVIYVLHVSTWYFKLGKSGGKGV